MVLEWNLVFNTMMLTMKVNNSGRLRCFPSTSAKQSIHLFKWLTGPPKLWVLLGTGDREAQPSFQCPPDTRQVLYKCLLNEWDVDKVLALVRRKRRGTINKGLTQVYHPVHGTQARWGHCSAPAGNWRCHSYGFEPSMGRFSFLPRKIVNLGHRRPLICPVPLTCATAPSNLRVPPSLSEPNITWQGAKRESLGIHRTAPLQAPYLHPNTAHRGFLGSHLHIWIPHIRQQNFWTLVSYLARVQITIRTNQKIKQL